MRFAFILTGGALAVAAPALAQTGAGQMTPPATSAPAPTATPTPMAPSTPSPSTAMPTTDSMGQTSAPAPAPAAGTTATATPTVVQPAVGATVYGAGGVSVGTIKAMDSQYVTLSTDKGEVRLPRAGVGPGLKGPVIGLTADQLDAAVTQANSSRPAATGAATAGAAEPATVTKRTTTRKPRRRR